VTRRLRTLTHRDEMKLLAALAVQPFLAAAVTFVLFPVVADRAGRSTDPLDAALSVAFGAAIVAFFMAIVCVLPAGLWAMRRNTLTLGRTILRGVCIANIPGILLTVLSGHGVLVPLRAVALASAIGVAGAAMFWVIAGRLPGEGS
jgi:hypothetical protein